MAVVGISEGKAGRAGGGENTEGMLDHAAFWRDLGR